MGIIGAILVLSFLVFFHELGHFLAAKLFGVRVEAFSIGFGKTRIFKKQIGETEYSLRPIPLGGFVQLKGQSDFDPKLRDTSDDSLYGIAHWKRLVILAAGFNGEKRISPHCRQGGSKYASATRRITKWR